MTWSATFGSRDAFLRDEPTYQPDPANTGQYGVARRAARLIIDAGVVVDDNQEFTVVLSGHSNPGHEPVPGAPMDGISVSITQVRAPVLPPMLPPMPTPPQ